MQDCNNSIASAMEWLHSCTRPSTYYMTNGRDISAKRIPQKALWIFLQCIKNTCIWPSVSWNFICTIAVNTNRIIIPGPSLAPDPWNVTRRGSSKGYLGPCLVAIFYTEGSFTIFCLCWPTTMDNNCIYTKWWDVITHPCHNSSYGFFKTPFKLEHG